MGELTQQYQAVMDQRKADLKHKQQIDRLASLETSVLSSMRQLVKFLDGKTTKTEVVNQLKDYATPSDIKTIVSALEKLDSSISGNKLDLTPVTNGLNALEQQLKKLPTKFPDLPDPAEEVTVKNQVDITPVIKAIKGLKLEAPKVDVTAPNVQVDAPDLKPLKAALTDVIKAIQGIDLPRTDLTKVEDELKKTNKSLEKLINKPSGGGGGGGNGTPYVNGSGKPLNVQLEANGSVPVTVKNSLTPNVDFDYIDIQQTSATVETYVYKQGGVSGTTVQTITVTYTDSTKNDLDKVEYS